MDFEFATPARIIFGVGSVTRSGRLASDLGSRAFVVTGRSVGRAMPLLDSLGETRLAHVPVPVAPEPDLDSLRDLLEQARIFRPDLLIGFGGGSAIDTAKALAALLANGGDPLDYVEVVGAGRPLAKPSLPCIALPTTAGTGSEATRNAVFTAQDADGLRVKVSLRSSSMLPSLAVVDPALALGTPARITVDCGLDAVTQLIEAFVCAKANPLADGICREGLGRAFRALPAAAASPDPIWARIDMAFASLCGGLALANAGLGAVHGIAGPLGGMTGIPHGAACAALLPAVVSANVRALEGGALPSGPDGTEGLLAKYAEIGTMARGRPSAAGDAGAILADFVSGLGGRRLGALGLDRGDFDRLAAAALKASSMKANALRLDEGDLLGILEAAW